MNMIPVFLFTGFLEAGKTSFIQGILEDERFNSGERILLLMCEDGEEELDPSKFSKDCVTVEMIDDPDKLSPSKLSALGRRCKAQKIVIEYNGMWQMNDLFDNLPPEWGIAEEIFFVDSTSIMNYNANMRSLVVDKLNTAELVIFNRCTENTDRMELHKLVRAISRGADIAYEDVIGKTEYDDIEDPLPFDIDAPVIEIDDKDYAYWYRDIADEMTKYEGKKVSFKAIVAVSGRMPSNTFVAGRHIMTCCEEDIKYSAVVCRWQGAYRPKNKDWVTLTGEISIQYSRIYGKKGPIVNITELQPAEKPDEEVVTFY